MSQSQEVIDAVSCPLCKKGQKQPCVYRTGDHDRVGHPTKECHPERTKKALLSPARESVDAPMCWVCPQPPFLT